MMSSISPATANPANPTPSAANFTVCNTLKQSAINSSTKLDVNNFVTGCLCVLK